MEIMSEIRKPSDVICRLCLKLMPLESCKKLDGLTSDILETLNLKLICFIEPMVCDNCSKRLENAFSFKSKYTDTEDFLFPYIKSALKENLDLQKIYWNEKKRQECSNEDLKVCRLCLEVTDHPVAIDESLEQSNFEELFTEYLPEVKLHVINNPIICAMCYDHFQDFIQFLKDCSATEEKLMVKCGLLNIDNESNELFTFILPDGEDMIKNENCELPGVRVQLVSKKEVDGVVEESNSINLLQVKAEADILEFKCEICSFETKSKYRLKRHMIVHRDPSEGKLFKCQECPMETNHKYLFYNHVRKAHSDEKPKKRFSCTQCTYASSSKGDMDRHVKRHKDPSELEKFQCEKCSYTSYDKQYMKNHSKIHLDPSETVTYHCGVCQYTSKYKDKVIRHELLHKDISEVETFGCDLCKYRARDKNSLALHSIIHKESAELFPCNFCSFKSKHKQSLKTHLKLHPTSPSTETFPCNLCDRSFKLKSYLQSHIRRHKMTEILQCALCSYNTNLKCNLSAHMNRVHNENAKIYECDECSYKTKLKGSLKHHKLSHRSISEVKQHMCTICSYVTKYKYCLQSHLKTHEKKRKHKVKQKDEKVEPESTDHQTE